MCIYRGADMPLPSPHWEIYPCPCLFSYYGVSIPVPHEDFNSYEYSRSYVKIQKEIKKKKEKFIKKHFLFFY